MTTDDHDGPRQPAEGEEGHGKVFVLDDDMDDNDLMAALNDAVQEADRAVERRQRERTGELLRERVMEEARKKRQREAEEASASAEVLDVELDLDDDDDEPEPAPRPRPVGDRVAVGSRPRPVTGEFSGSKLAEHKVKALEKKLDEAEQQREEFKKRLGQMNAETVSYRKRLEGKAEQARHGGREDVFRTLLGIIDNMEAAVRSSKQSQDFDALVTGVEMVVKQLFSELAQLGLETFEPLGQPFDPAHHEAFRSQPTDEHPPGHVLEVVRRGYLVGGRLLRPALVVVTSASEQE